MKQDGPVMRFFRGVGLAQHQPDRRRLASDICSLTAWVESHKPSTATKSECPSPADCDEQPTAIGREDPSLVDSQRASAAIDADSPSRPWFEVCECCLQEANEAADRHDVASGYEYLHMAERESVPGMSPAERKIRALSLRAEVEKKLEGSWRADAIRGLLGKDDADVSAESLAEAIGHRNMHDRNSHRKTDKLRWQLAWLGLIVCVLVLIAVGFAVWGPSPNNLENQDLLPYGIYLGLLGGFLSSAISVRGIDWRARVPEVEVAFYAAIARGLLGAAASIPVFVIGKAGLVTLGGAASQTWGLLLLCFISGFSERWFLNTVGAATLDDKKQPASDKALR